MAFVRPSLREIINRVEGDIKGALGITTILRRSFLSAFSSAVGGTSHTLHGHLNFISRQVFPDQADAEFLDRWGSIYGIERQPATFAEVEIAITFTAAATLPAGTVFQRVDGSEYTLNADVDALAAGTETGVITSETAGSTFNLVSGDIVSLQSAVANISGDAVAGTTTVEGEDTELDPSYRQRIVDRIQQPPAGGTPNDYITFARSVSGVTRAWVFPGHLGEGTVGVSFVQDNDADIIPSAAEVEAVQTAVDLAKPVTANATVFAPDETVVNFSIALKPNTAVVRAAVEAEIKDVFATEVEVRGAFESITSEFDGKIAISRINEAISIAEGEEDHTLISPATDLQPPNNGGILTFGTITFTTLA